jgi:hypothetical protein
MSLEQHHKRLLEQGRRQMGLGVRPMPGFDVPGKTRPTDTDVGETSISQTEVAQLLKEQDVLKDKLSRAQTDLASTRSDFDLQKQLVEDLKQDIDVNKSARKDLESKYAVLESELSARKLDLVERENEWSQQFSDLKTKLLEAENRCEELALRTPASNTVSIELISLDKKKYVRVPVVVGDPDGSDEKISTMIFVSKKEWEAIIARQQEVFAVGKSAEAIAKSRLDLWNELVSFDMDTTQQK